MRSLQMCGQASVIKFVILSLWFVYRNLSETSMKPTKLVSYVRAEPEQLSGP